MPKPEPTKIDLRWTNTESVSSRAYDCLDDAERALAERLPHSARAPYVAAHSLLRMMLSEWEARPPRSWRFATGEYGKPYLRDSQLRFNISHSTHHAVVAVSDGAEIGVDVEEITPHRVDAEIARRMFSEVDFQQWVEAQDQVATFFQLWTLKEAYMKAAGLGVHLPLQDFSVILSPPQLIHRKVRQSDWHLSSQVLEAKAVMGLVAKPDPGRSVEITLRHVTV